MVWGEPRTCKGDLGEGAWPVSAPSRRELEAAAALRPLGSAGLCLHGASKKLSSRGKSKERLGEGRGSGERPSLAQVLLASPTVCP